MIMVQGALLDGIFIGEIPMELRLWTHLIKIQSFTKSVMLLAFLTLMKILQILIGTLKTP